MLSEACEAALPRYMVPSAFVCLSAWPLNSSGKVDRKQLPEPEASNGAGEYVAARTVPEQWVAAAMAEVLQLDRAPSATMDLLSVGLTSLLAVRVSSLLRSRHDLTVPTATVLRLRTIAGIAASMAESSERDDEALVRRDRATEDVALPLSYEQEQMWVLYQLDRSSGAYNVPAVHRLRGVLDVERLCGAVEAAAHRHETLRMRYGEGDDGSAFQRAVLCECWDVGVREVTVGSVSEALAEVLLECESSMELEMCSVRLLVVHVGTADEDHMMVLNVHHIATDGWSTEHLLGDVVSAYNALAGGRSVNVGDERGLRYADYAQWQREMLSDEARVEPHERYWREALGGELPVLELQTDHPRPAVLTSHGGSVDVCIDDVASDGLRALCRQCGATTMRGALAVWAVTLGKHSGQDEVVVGIPYANREHPATHSVVGYFVNTLAIRVRVDGSASFRESLVHVNSVTNEAMAHAAVPFMRVMAIVCSDRDASRTPVFQTMLTWEEAAGWGGDGFMSLWMLESVGDAWGYGVDEQSNAPSTSTSTSTSP